MEERPNTVAVGRGRQRMTVAELREAAHVFREAAGSPGGASIEKALSLTTRILEAPFAWYHAMWERSTPEKQIYRACDEIRAGTLSKRVLKQAAIALDRLADAEEGDRSDEPAPMNGPAVVVPTVKVAPTTGRGPEQPGVPRTTLHRLRDEQGREIDARFGVELVGDRIAVLLESRSGTRGSVHARNTDYAHGLDLILKRLGQAKARIADAQVYSRVLLQRDESERRLRVEGRPYPITIDDPNDLRRRIQAAQVNVGRAPGAQGQGNATKRLCLFPVFDGYSPKPDDLAAAIAGLDEAAGRGVSGVGVSPIGAEYRRAEPTTLTERDPFEVDPVKVERGNRAHASCQNAFADFLLEQGISPRSPGRDDPEYDLGWEIGDVLFVAEVKSITDSNEEKQLRLGLGQVLRYRHLLAAHDRHVVAVLVAERKPVDPTWVDLCRELRVRLVWPGDFESAISVDTLSRQQA